MCKFKRNQGRFQMQARQAEAYIQYIFREKLGSSLYQKNTRQSSYVIFFSFFLFLKAKVMFHPLVLLFGRARLTDGLFIFTGKSQFRKYCCFTENLGANVGFKRKKRVEISFNRQCISFKRWRVQANIIIMARVLGFSRIM